jgi:hypothetical protein
MSGIHEAPNTSGVLEDKPAFQTSSTDVSKTSKVKYSLDGVEDADPTYDVYSRANAPRPGFTKNDQKDMYRMGKIQEFRVRWHHKHWKIIGAQMLDI